MGILKGVLQPLVDTAWRLMHPSAKSPSTSEDDTVRLRWNDITSQYFPNWFQLGQNKPTTRQAMASSAVYSCISILSQETARLDIHHYKVLEDQSRVRVNSSAPAVVLRKPNPYQSKSDWMLFMMQALLSDGNAYAVAERDSRGAVSALHPYYPGTVQVMRVSGTYDHYYHVGQFAFEGITQDVFVPQRDMLHLRLFTLADPILGISPLQALGPAIVLGANIQEQSASFFQNMSRPAGILRTPKPLSKEAAERLRDQWEKGMSGHFVGRTAVLDNDVDWRPLSMSAVDAEVIAQYKMSVETIAQVYRIPMFMLGDMTKATFRNVESLQKAFVMSALGFYLAHIENALHDFFGLDPNEHLEFDLERGLMRPDLKERMEAYTTGIRGGVYAPNEPRARENLPPKEGGDEIYIQKQNVPLSAAAALAEAEIAGSVQDLREGANPDDDPDPEQLEDQRDESEDDDEATETYIRAVFEKLRKVA